MQGDGQTGLLSGGLDHAVQIGVTGILTGRAGNLQDNGAVQLLAGVNDTLDDLHVVDVESADGVAALVGLLEHFFGVYECHSLFLLDGNIL